MYGGLGRTNKTARHTPPMQHLPNYAALLGGKGALGDRARRRLASGLEGECRTPPTGEARLGSVEQGTLGCRGAGIPQWPRPLARPLVAASVAMRCCETPVNKPCLDSGARAQGLFA